MQPIGVVLAGGAGRRLGGDKAMAVLDGRPLALHVAEALRALCPQVVAVAKRDTLLPEGLERWDEPDSPRHPLVGVVAALERAQQDVLVCAVDLPLAGPALSRLAEGDGLRVARDTDGNLQPLCARWPVEVLEPLQHALRFEHPMRLVVQGLDAVPVPVPPAALLNVNDPDDLALAEARVREARSG